MLTIAMCRCLSPIIVLASYVKIYCVPIWRNLHFLVPVDYRNSIASKIDATHVIKSKSHSIIQFVMPRNAGKMNQRVYRVRQKKVIPCRILLIFKQPP